MRKTILLALSSSFILGSAWSQSASDIFSAAFRPEMPRIQRFSPDGRSFINTHKRDDQWSLSLSDIRSGDSTGLLFESSEFASQASHWNEKLPMGSFDLTADGRFLVVSYASEAIYRHSRSVMCYVIDLQKKTLTPIPSRLRYPTLNPQGTQLAYVKDNNLCIFDLESKSETLVTEDGETNYIINGAVDWVYEEEFSMSQGFAWSPSGQYIAFYRFDESEVQQFGMDEYNKEVYPDREVWKYPKAGEDNAEVKVGIYNVQNGEIAFPELGHENDQYLPRIQWSLSDDLLTVQRLNRWQNHWELLGINPKQTTKVSVLLEEQDEAYVDIQDNLFFLPHLNGEPCHQLIYASEKGGFNQLYLLNYLSGKESALTFGMSEVLAVKEWNEERRELLYTIADNALEDDLMAVNLGAKKGQYLPGKTRLVTCFNYTHVTNNQSLRAQQEGNSFAGTGSHYCMVGPKGHFYYDGFSNLSHNPVYAWSLNSIDGSFHQDLELNSKWTAAVQDWGLGSVKFDQVPGADGTPLNRYTIYPPEFDSTQQYPVLMFCYGGPGANTVKNAYGSRNFLWHQYLAKQGYIVSSTDNRGTGRRGSAFKKSTYLKLGDLECKDQTAVAEWWRTQSYVNPERIGIWGWSFGGYLSSLCLSKSPETFSMAIAVAPVTHWKYYDNIYTERYLRRPIDNPDGYEQNSPLNFAHQITGKYLIVHGTADDNVHFQNSVEMVNALIAGGIDFDSEYYPNRNHGISDPAAQKHLFNRLTAFVLENL